MDPNDAKAPLRELFIEELAGVTGGTDPLETVAVWQWLKDQLFNTTHACGEEGSDC